MSDEFVRTRGNNNISRVFKLENTGKQKQKTEGCKKNSRKAKVAVNSTKEGNPVSEILEKNDESSQKSYAGYSDFCTKNKINAGTIQDSGCDSTYKCPYKVDEVRKKNEEIIRNINESDNAGYEANKYNYFRFQPKTTTDKIIYYFLLNEYLLLIVFMLFGIYPCMYYLSRNQLKLAVGMAIIATMVIFVWVVIGNWHARKLNRLRMQEKFRQEISESCRKKEIK